MKQKNLIFLVILGCVGLIVIGTYNLCARRGSMYSEVETCPGRGPVVKDVLRDDVEEHYRNLDHVVMPAAVESAEHDYEGFRLSFNRHNRTPNWVAWELLGRETEGEAKRHNKFWQDRRVDGCPTTDDYKNSGYDRGHMCPAAEQRWSRKAMDDCFVMANMCPQDHALNSGAWNTLENKERLWARRDSAIVIVAGPLYEPDSRNTIGDGVLVPSAFFKVLLAPYVDKPRSIAFVYPNMSSPGNMQNYVMTVDDLERLTGYDFFAALPDSLENEVEAVASFREWNGR